MVHVPFQAHRLNQVEVGWGTLWGVGVTMEQEYSHNIIAFLNILLCKIGENQIFCP